MFSLALVVGFAPMGFAQALAALPALTLPEAIFWKQNLFLIPYQWSSGADPGTATTVWLLVSQDGGATWQKISEAKPHLKAFNYHAPADGEYMFAIRTIDARGQAWPAGPYQPELRVIVDTMMPRIDELAGEILPNGQLAIRWRATDLNLDPNSWRIETQSTPDAPWQPVTIDNPTSGQLHWLPPLGAAPIALRATVLDRAGNSAVFHARVNANPIGPITSVESSSPFNQTPTAADRSVQPWPANTTTHSPFRLADGGGAFAGDGATTYGRPPIVDNSTTAEAIAVTAPSDGHSGWASPGAVESTSPTPQPEVDRFAMVPASTSAAIRPLEPFRETTTSSESQTSDIAPVQGTPPPAPATNASEVAPPPSLLQPETTPSAPEPSLSFAKPTHGEPQQPLAAPVIQPPVGVVPKQVGARTFALEYQLADLGQWGVSRVELWGTHNGGQTWQRFADDDDHRSPIYVTVDNAGLYGFRIVVEAAGGPAASVPRQGDEPELWVTVDLERPRVELTSIQPGSGGTSDQLMLRWQAEDANLEPRPIALLYSSRASGPWSAIATGLANTGEYTWHVERHVPPRVYLRLEARDAAGNLAAYQTAEPFALPTPQPTGELQTVTPAGPTATGAESAFR